MNPPSPVGKNIATVCDSIFAFINFIPASRISSTVVSVACLTFYEQNLMMRSEQLAVSSITCFSTILGNAISVTCREGCVWEAFLLYVKANTRKAIPVNDGAARTLAFPGTKLLPIPRRSNTRNNYFSISNLIHCSLDLPFP